MAAMSMPTTDVGLREYYARRAAEYERVYAKPERQADLHAMAQWLTPCFAGRHGLEIACGTGWWTPAAAQDSASWLATDINAETLAIARTKTLPPGKVRFGLADAYAPETIEGAFDTVFAGFWWSHVPLSKLSPWLARLHGRLPAGARLVFIDNRYVEGSSTPLSRRDAEGNTYQVRQLDDGSAHEVLKNFPTRDEATAALGPRATQIQWREWTHYWALHYRLG